MRRNSSLLPHMVYFSATQKRVFHEAAKRSLTSLNSYIRDLLTRDVELRAEQGEPYFEGLRDELRAGQSSKLEKQADEQSTVRHSCGEGCGVPYPLCFCGHRYDHHRHCSPEKCYQCEACTGYEASNTLEPAEVPSTGIPPHGFTDEERIELGKRGLGSESSGESIRAALKEIRSHNSPSENIEGEISHGNI